jgi:hypothetical protein
LSEKTKCNASVHFEGYKRLSTDRDPNFFKYLITQLFNYRREKFGTRLFEINNLLVKWLISMKRSLVLSCLSNRCKNIEFVQLGILTLLYYCKIKLKLTTWLF